MRILSRGPSAVAASPLWRDPRQAKPDFGGKWRLLPEPGAPPAPPALVPRPDLTIVQTAATLTTEEPAGGGRTVTVVYRLDGAEMRQTINRADVVTRAEWDADALVTTVTGANANWKDRWTLADGRLMIATTVPGRTLASTRRFERF